MLLVDLESLRNRQPSLCFACTSAGTLPGVQALTLMPQKAQITESPSPKKYRPVFASSLPWTMLSIGQ